MKSYEYCCDGGTILFGNEQWNIAIPNDYGDGTHNVRVMSEKEFICKYKNKGYRWRGVCEGEFNIYDYDYIEDDPEVLITLKGKYSIYTCFGNVLFVK